MGGIKLIAIDPGVAGGIAYCLRDGECNAFKMPPTDREIADWLDNDIERVAYLEALVKFAGTNMPSSAMAAYAGNQRFVAGVLTSLRYKIIEVPPQKWQKALGLGNRKSHASKTAWKNHLKQRAEQLFPEIKVTLATADALLILEAAKRGLLG